MRIVPWVALIWWPDCITRIILSFQILKRMPVRLNAQARAWRSIYWNWSLTHDVSSYLSNYTRQVQTHSKYSCHSFATLNSGAGSPFLERNATMASWKISISVQALLYVVRISPWILGLSWCLKTSTACWMMAIASSIFSSLSNSLEAQRASDIGGIPHHS